MLEKDGIALVKENSDHEKEIIEIRDVKEIIRTRSHEHNVMTAAVEPVMARKRKCTEEQKSSEIFGNSKRMPFGWRKVDREIHNFVVNSYTLESLIPKKTLVDDVIDAFVQSRIDMAEDNYLDIYAFNCFFYNICELANNKQDVHWSSEMTFFKHDVCLIPVCTEGHWILLVFVIKHRKILFLDSLGYGQEFVENILKQVLYKLNVGYFVEYGEHANWSDWDVHIPRDLVIQNNNYDCGVHLCIYVHIICTGTNVKVKNNEINSVRYFIAETLSQFNTQKKSRGNTLRRAINDDEFKVKVHGIGNLVLNYTPPLKNYSTIEYLSSLSKLLTKATKYRCGMTKNCLQVKEDMVKCVGCKEWLHPTCSKRISTGPFPEFYECTECKKKKKK
jgi:Ulp1 family protease